MEQNVIEWNRKEQNRIEWNTTKYSIKIKIKILKIKKNKKIKIKIKDRWKVIDWIKHKTLQKWKIDINYRIKRRYLYITRGKQTLLFLITTRKT